MLRQPIGYVTQRVWSILRVSDTIKPAASCGDEGRARLVRLGSKLSLRERVIERGELCRRMFYNSHHHQPRHDTATSGPSAASPHCVSLLFRDDWWATYVISGWG